MQQIDPELLESQIRNLIEELMPQFNKENETKTHENIHLTT
jgi:hypothetical protein